MQIGSPSETQELRCGTESFNTSTIKSQQPAQFYRMTVPDKPIQVHAHRQVMCTQCLITALLVGIG